MTAGEPVSLSSQEADNHSRLSRLSLSCYSRFVIARLLGFLGCCNLKFVIRDCLSFKFDSHPTHEELLQSTYEC